QVPLTAENAEHFKLSKIALQKVPFALKYPRSALCFALPGGAPPAPLPLCKKAAFAPRDTERTYTSALVPPTGQRRCRPARAPFHSIKTRLFLHFATAGPSA